MTQQLLWHYTFSHRIKQILESGALLPPTHTMGQGDYLSDVEQQRLQGNKGVLADQKMLLFSENQEWEPAAYRAWLEKDGSQVNLYERADYARYGVRIYRIGVDRKILKPWVRLKSLTRMPADYARGVENTAYDLGSNPFHWWGTLFPVPLEKWEALEVLEGESWIDFTADVQALAGS